MIIWITGISGAGKTTIANFLLKKLRKTYSNLVNLDGDVIRNLYGDELGYDVNSRIKQIKRIQKLCSFLENQGKLIVVVAALYAEETLLRWNRRNFKKYLEVYLDASIDLVKKEEIQKIFIKNISWVKKKI